MRAPNGAEAAAREAGEPGGVARAQVGPRAADGGQGEQEQELEHDDDLDKGKSKSWAKARSFAGFDPRANLHKMSLLV